MAQVVTRTFVDDITGEPAERTFPFSADGVDYEIDLSTDNIAEFNHAIAGFVESARRVPKGRTRARSTSTVKANREHLAAVRSWARQNGLVVSDRGRVSAEIMAKFDAAHAGA